MMYIVCDEIFFTLNHVIFGVIVCGMIGRFGVPFTAQHPSKPLSRSLYIGTCLYASPCSPTSPSWYVLSVPASRRKGNFCWKFLSGLFDVFSTFFFTQVFLIWYFLRIRIHRTKDSIVRVILLVNFGDFLLSVFILHC